MESAIDDSYVVFADVAFAVRPITCKHRANPVDVRGIYGFAIEIALPKLNANGSLPSTVVLPFLALIEHGIHLPHVGLVIDNSAFDLNPCVCLERHLLSADHHLGTDAVSLQQTCRCGRSL